ncbi:hydroxymethylglutaryl-CoA synthase [Actinomadura sp. LD22]|uniref:Hydroxymethylglutaryl-CoA synthase n=1 Tax=Actinomadura physcomitrii TaxID=2650748 RepID=A0A6I4M7H8_9ACTN|nr:OB-fold domain-containing protein [Actinomadura physcomitrii]MWA00940.1 hydroxymethylglutaryl-CoA synthase [Actinomadura physcomitrii]
MGGLIAYGAYVPHRRLRRAEIAAVLGGPAAPGTRAVAGHDEDSTSLGVEAGRTALRGLPQGHAPRRLFFASSAPAYTDKTNATAVHAALRLDRSAPAADMCGAIRSGLDAVTAAVDSPVPALAVLSDLRGGLPGGADERDGGDAAAALLFSGSGDEASTAPVIAELLGQGWATAEFLDRWRPQGDISSRIWEERFGEQAYVPLAEAAFAQALKKADLTPDAVDHLIVAGAHGRAVRAAAARTGVPREAWADDLTRAIGNPGTAQFGVVLCDVLDRAGAGETIAVLLLADGASSLVFRTTEALGERRSSPAVAEQIAGGDDSLPYATFLTWRGLLDREPPRRPDPEPPYAPPMYRSTDWKYAFVAGRCASCGTRHLPPADVCRACRHTGEMEPEPMADVPATIATFTVDHLAYSLSPPVISAVVDFDGGGRLRCELTDTDPGAVRIGDRVEMSFRRTQTARGVHNYFWKARPARRVPGQG